MTTQIADDSVSSAAPALRASTGKALWDALLSALPFAKQRGDTPNESVSRSTYAPSIFKREPIFEFEETYPAPSPSSTRAAALHARHKPAATLAQPGDRAWSPTVLPNMHWQRFETLCEVFFEQVGFATHAKSHGEEGGVDLWLQSMRMDAPRIVRCKHRPTKPVGLKELRDFLGVMQSNQLKHGSYVTSSTFTPDALAFAKENGIQAQDGAALLKLISHRTPGQQAALLSLAYRDRPD